jgi:hypothetical protein
MVGIRPTNETHNIKDILKHQFDPVIIWLTLKFLNLLLDITEELSKQKSDLYHNPCIHEPLWYELHKMINTNAIKQYFFY